MTGTQLSLGGVLRSAAAESWDTQLDLVRQAVAEATPKEVAYRLDVAPSYLLDALRGADRKSVKAEWLTPILDLATETTRHAFLAEFCGRRYTVERRPELGPEAELAKTRDLLAKLAPGLLTLVDKELGR